MSSFSVYCSLFLGKDNIVRAMFPAMELSSENSSLAQERG